MRSTSIEGNNLSNYSTTQRPHAWSSLVLSENASCCCSVVVGIHLSKCDIWLSSFDSTYKEAFERTPRLGPASCRLSVTIVSKAFASTYTGRTVWMVSLAPQRSLGRGQHCMHFVNLRTIHGSYCDRNRLVIVRQ